MSPPSVAVGTAPANAGVVTGEKIQNFTSRAFLGLFWLKIVTVPSRVTFGGFASGRGGPSSYLWGFLTDLSPPSVVVGTASAYAGVVTGEKIQKITF